VRSFINKTKVRWLEDVENDVREMKVKRWRQRAVDREDWPSVINLWAAEFYI
jgi:hypothetical protein